MSMTRKVRIIFPDISKTNPYTKCKISKLCWEKQFEQWRKNDQTLYIIAYFEKDPIASGFGRATHIGDVKAVELDFPKLVLEGELFTDDPLVLSRGFDFNIQNEFKTEQLDFDSFDPEYTIVSMEINQLILSPDPVFPSIMEYEDNTEYAECSDMRCINCRNPFEAFEHIIKYRGNYYHENCFFEDAVEILQAKPLHLDSSGKVEEEEDELHYYEEDRYIL